MRNEPLKGFLKKSPIKKDYDFKKSNVYTGESGTTGAKIAKALTPTNLAEVIPIGKVGKLAKAAYKYIKG